MNKSFKIYFKNWLGLLSIKPGGLVALVGGVCSSWPGPGEWGKLTGGHHGDLKVGACEWGLASMWLTKSHLAESTESGCTGDSDRRGHAELTGEDGNLWQQLKESVRKREGLHIHRGGGLSPAGGRLGGNGNSCFLLWSSVVHQNTSEF